MNFFIKKAQYVYLIFSLINWTKDLPILHAIAYLYCKSLSGLWVSFIILSSKENTFCFYPPFNSPDLKDKLVY